MSYSISALDVKYICDQRPGNLISLVKRLINIEIRHESVKVLDQYIPERYTVPDGGEDGFLKIEMGKGDWLNNNVMVFQFKTSNLSPAKIRNEVVDASTANLKRSIIQVLNQGGSYFLFSSNEVGSRILLNKLEDGLFNIFSQKIPTVLRSQVRIFDAQRMSNLINQRIEAVFYCYRLLRRHLPEGMRLFEQLIKQNQDNYQIYFSQPKLDQYKYLIQSFIQNGEKIVRVVGEPGIGKTSLVLESLKDISNRKDIIYFNISKEEVILDFLDQYDNRDLIFILDNCSIELHNKIRKIVNHQKAQFKVISIDSELNEQNNRYLYADDLFIILTIDDMTLVVKQIIDYRYANTMDASSRQILADYADGNPLLASLISSANLKTSAECTNIYDESVFNKILFGPRNIETNPDVVYTAVRAFSLFSYFGFPNIELEPYLNELEIQNLKLQGEFIAEKICKPKLEFATLNEVFIKLKRRGVIQQKGRFYEVRPNSLAYFQAAEYLNGLTDASEFILIQNELESYGLAVPLYDRFKYLDQNRYAKLIAERIFGEQRPFGTAEVLNTELGSRLFRSLVEVNPEALIKTLVKLYLNEPFLELFKVVKGRRNLIWSLQMLCFNKNTFDQAARILYRFAQAENEDWSNNSKGIFKQIFRPFLSGTEADFDARLKILEYAISQPFVENNEFLIDAVMSAFEIQGASRMGGPERQGTRVLKDFSPTKLEVLNYWEKVKILLIVLWKQHEKYRVLIEKKFYWKSLQILSVADPEFVTNFIDWLESNDVSIPTSFYRSLERQLNLNRLSESAKIKVAEFLELKKPLTPEKIFIRQVRDAVFSPGKDGKGMDKDNTEVEVRKLACEFRDGGIEITDLIDLMLTDQQMYTEVFIHEYVSQYEQQGKTVLFILAVEELKQIEPKERNWSVLKGVLRSSSEDEKLKLILFLGEIDGFEEIFINLVNLNLKSVKELERIWDLITRKSYTSEIASKLRMGYFAFKESFDATRYICDKLKSLGDIGYWSLLDILSLRITHGTSVGDEEWDYCHEIFLQYDYFDLETKPEFIELYDLTEISKKLLNKFPEGGLFNRITDGLLRYLKTTHSVQNEDLLRELANQMIETDFDSFWIKLSETLLSSDLMVYYLKDMFGSDHGNTGTTRDGILFSNSVNYDKIIGWCKQNTTKGPVIIAVLMPIYDVENKTWHPFAKKMINEFGYNKNFLSEMSVNMGSFGFWGSPVGYYKIERNLYEQLLPHKTPTVRDFAIKQIENLTLMIERQKLEDEERFLGL